MGELVNVEQLLHKSWFKPVGLQTLLLVLYMPLGICLLIIRGFILLQYFLLALLLPPSKFRQKCLRVMSAVLGISVSSEGDVDQRREKVFVANHITSFDHIAVNLASGAVTPTKEHFSSFITKTLGLIRLSIESLTKEEIESGSEPILIFPEGESTNGEVGLLAFSAVEIPTGVNIQPVAITVSRVFFNCNAVGGSLWQEIIVTLIAPTTHFMLRFLPNEVADTEGVWKQKTQQAIAHSLGLTATKLNSSDKAEFVKRLFFRPPSLATMTREVQRQLLPQNVSTELILTTIQRMGSVEAAVENLRQILQAGGEASLPSTFSKSATQRMMSFKERKRIMIASCRQKYIEKHGIVLPTPQ